MDESQRFRQVRLGNKNLARLNQIPLVCYPSQSMRDSKGEITPDLGTLLDRSRRRA
jgi:hypothetical protein